MKGRKVKTGVEMTRILSVVLAAGLAVFAHTASAQGVETIRADAGQGATITIHVYKPSGQGPFPLMVMSHGSPRQSSRRAAMGIETLATQARAYAVKGWVVAVPIRRGYGAMGGGYVEGIGDCQSPDYESAGLATAHDIRAAVAAVSSDAAVDKGRIVLFGVSAGGWGSIAAASQGLPGLRAVVNFAGGRGSRGPNTVCAEERLIAAIKRFGGSTTPQLWIYARNDLYFGPELARRMHEAFVAAGGRANFVMAPPHGPDGHFYFRAVDAWQDLVDAFLKQAGAI